MNKKYNSFGSGWIKWSRRIPLNFVSLHVLVVSPSFLPSLALFFDASQHCAVDWCRPQRGGMEAILARDQKFTHKQLTTNTPPPTDVDITPYTSSHAQRIFSCSSALYFVFFLLSISILQPAIPTLRSGGICQETRGFQEATCMWALQTRRFGGCWLR